MTAEEVITGGGMRMTAEEEVSQGTAESIELAHGDSSFKIDNPSMTEIIALGMIGACMMSGVIVWLTRGRRAK